MTIRLANIPQLSLPALLSLRLLHNLASMERQRNPTLNVDKSGNHIWSDIDKELDALRVREWGSRPVTATHRAA